MPLFSKKLTPTTITTNIEKAVSQEELDWALMYEICEVVNNSELGAKEARKLLQKKMLLPNSKTQVISLEILNALSENCRSKMQSQICAKTFGEDLEKLATRLTVEDEVHSRLHQCLQHWVSVYGQDPSAGAICRIHELVTHGTANTGRGAIRNPIPPAQQQQPVAPGPARGSHQPADILADVELAKNNAQLFSQTLSFTDPTNEDITKNDLIQEFYSKCKMFQRVISDHLQSCEDADLVSALILANGELINTFKAYDDMLEHGAIDAATNNSRSVNARGTGDEKTLISQDSHGQSSSSRSDSHIQQDQQTYPDLPNVLGDPFDPFADANAGNSTATAEGDLPPPLKPQRLHE